MSDILRRIDALLDAYGSGALGGERMPEDANPALERASRENYMYFTLPMALNYQRSSYALWECANRLYADAPSVFDSRKVCEMPQNELRSLLVEYKVALQPNKQPAVWRTLCETVENDLCGDIRSIFAICGNSAAKVKEYIANNRKKFPYLAGSKICNYWLYVLEQRTYLRFVDRGNITVAPDTHVIQASVRLGVISDAEAARSDVRELVAERWNALLADTPLDPIDIHTPMWLWSRGKFAIDI